MLLQTIQYMWKKQMTSGSAGYNLFAGEAKTLFPCWVMPVLLELKMENSFWIFWKNLFKIKSFEKELY